MRVVIVRVLTLIILCSFSVGESKQERGWALLQRCLHETLNNANPTPYALHATFTFARPRADPAPGTYKLQWISWDRWRREIKVGNLLEIAVGGKSKKWIQRSLDAEPLLAQRLITSIEYLQDLHLDTADQITKINTQKRSGVQLQCVSYKRVVGLERTLCFDDRNGSLALVRDGLWDFEYSQPKEFDGRFLPSTIRISNQGHLRMEASVNLGTLDSMDATRCDVPLKSQEWSNCEKPVPGKALLKVPPKYPERARQDHVEGTVVLYHVMETDGSLQNLKVIQSAGADLDQAAMTAVKQWKYAPTTCEGTPIRVESETQINFTLSY